MTIENVRAIVRKLLESDVPMNEYHVIVDRKNGDGTVTVCRCLKSSFPHMCELSKIFNAHSEDWEVSVEGNNIKIVVK